MSKLPGAASGAPIISDLPSTIGGRYRVLKLLGRGGMAIVLAVHDLVRRKDVALKRLLPLTDPIKQRRNHELFEREFHLLSQLAHPHIVQVYDFAFDAGEAYYTMEMLGGRDLQQLAPMPWRDACAAARDVCSALSLLHSRRLLHRDVSPRNVYWQGAGLAKLIDFGVTVAMGPSKLLVGTPPCCAPENVHLQSLDGRSDLFALGATLYFALVGRHAYAAPRFSDLHEAWRRGFPRPSELVADVPEALDAIVIDLLHLDRDARPANAAEVIERLVAIDAALANETLHTAAAYLATPPLVGRDAELERVRRRLEHAADERSHSIIIEGRSGVGRTRLLDASVLSATLAGRTVVRCDADDAQSGEYGVARAIAHRLFELLPLEAAETAAAYQTQLANIVSDTDAAPSVSRPQLQQALRGWLMSLHQRRPFSLAVDDIHRIDEPSASMLALLEDSSVAARPCLLLSAETNASWTAPAAQNLLLGVSVLKLGNLPAADCEKLLGTLFGDEAPNLELLAARTYAVCAGNPGDLLRLVQHLIDRGLIRYAAGAWALPSEIDSADLPASLAHALSTRITRLDESARRLGQALALCPDEKLSLDECALLCGEASRSQLLSACEQLTQAEIARRVDERITLSQASWVPLLRATLTLQEQLTLETTLARVIERRPDQELRAAQHWLRGGDTQHALDLLVAHSASSQEKTARSTELFASYLRTLPADWYDTFDQAIALCDKLGRPKKHKLILLSRLSGILPMLNTFAPSHMMTLFESLKRDSGLEDWEALSAETDPKQRLMKALGQARTRYEATPEAERVNDPSVAIQHLTRAVVGAGGSVMLSLDLPHLRSWPQLQPLSLLSPAIEVAVKLVAGIDARLAGRTVRAQQLYLDLLSMVQRPDRAGMDASHAGYIALGVMNGLGMLDAMTGADSCLTWAERISVNPSYAVNAMLIRVLHHLWNGDAASADEGKRAAHRLRIQNIGRPMYEGQHLIGEVQAYALSGDLTRMRHARDEIAPFAKRYVQWLPVLGYARAEYARLVGDANRALEYIEQVLALAACGMHQIWPAAASAHVTTLLDLDRAQLAAEHADRYIELARRELGYEPEVMSLSRALARAQRGDSDAAALADEVIEHMHQAGFGKLLLGSAHEVRARIALTTRDGAAFEAHAQTCRKLLTVHKNAPLTVKCQRLLRDGARALGAGRTPLSPSPDLESEYSGSRVELALATCADAKQRAKLALNVLLSQSHAVAGSLFTLSPEGVECAAQLGEHGHAEQWLQPVLEFIDAQQEATATVTQSDDDEDSAIWFDDHGREHHPLLLCHYDAGKLFITGVAVLQKSDDSAVLPPLEAAAAISRFYAHCGARTLAT